MRIKIWVRKKASFAVLILYQAWFWVLFRNILQVLLYLGWEMWTPTSWLEELRWVVGLEWKMWEAQATGLGPVVQVA